MPKGQILLKRTERNYLSGFCIMKTSQKNLEKEMDLLHHREVAFYQKLKYKRRQLSYLISRIASKKAITQIVEYINPQHIFVDIGIFYFPVVKGISDKNIQVSISHCDNLGAAIAFPEDHPLGVDLEKIDLDKTAGIKSQLDEEEMHLIQSLHTEEAFALTLFWTIKEAFSKILKAGLTMDFKHLKVASITVEDGIYLSTFEHFGQYKAYSSRQGSYILTIVLPRNTSVNLVDFWNAFREVDQS